MDFNPILVIVCISVIVALLALLFRRSGRTHSQRSLRRRRDSGAGVTPVVAPVGTSDSGSSSCAPSTGDGGAAAGGGGC